MNVHTIFPGGRPEGYFTNENIEYLRSRLAELLQLAYHQIINVDRGGIIRVMTRVIEQRLEPIPKMNQRVLMELMDEFNNHQGQARKHMKWEEHYEQSQALYDPTTDRQSFDGARVKLSNRLGIPTTGGTVRFMFI